MHVKASLKLRLLQSSGNLFGRGLVDVLFVIASGSLVLRALGRWGLPVFEALGHSLTEYSVISIMPADLLFEPHLVDREAFLTYRQLFHYISDLFLCAVKYLGFSMIRQTSWGLSEQLSCTKGIFKVLMMILRGLQIKRCCGIWFFKIDFLDISFRLGIFIAEGSDHILADSIL